jgi:hypothetical protein
MLYPLKKRWREGLDQNPSLLGARLRKSKLTLDKKEMR